MRTFFNPDNFLWRWCGKLADFVMLSCVWVLCCIPVVTIGSSTIALYDAAAHCVYGKEPGPLRRFFKTFKQELVRGILMTLLWGAIALVLNMGYQAVCQLAPGSIGSTVYFCSLVIPLSIACWAVILESRFVYSFGALHKNAVLFTFAHLPQTIAIVALFILALNVCFNIIPLVMVIPGLMVYLQALFAERILVKYMPKDEEE